MSETPGINLFMFAHKFVNLSQTEYDAQISLYRDWLDQHGRYGKLYMWKIGKLPERTDFTGVTIYDSEIAILFKLMFEI
jgi:hypothetical protein